MAKKSLISSIFGSTKKPEKSTSKNIGTQQILMKMADDINVTKLNVIKLVEIQKVTPAMKAEDFFERQKEKEDAYESGFRRGSGGASSKSPTRSGPGFIERGAKSNPFDFMKFLWNSLLKAGMLTGLGYGLLKILESPENRTKIADFLRDFFEGFLKLVKLGAETLKEVLTGDKDGKIKEGIISTFLAIVDLLVTAIGKISEVLTDPRIWEGIYKIVKAVLKSIYDILNTEVEIEGVKMKLATIVLTVAGAMWALNTALGGASKAVGSFGAGLLALLGRLGLNPVVLGTGAAIALTTSNEAAIKEAAKKGDLKTLDSLIATSKTMYGGEYGAGPSIDDMQQEQIRLLKEANTAESKKALEILQKRVSDRKQLEKDMEELGRLRSEKTIKSRKYGQKGTAGTWTEKDEKRLRELELIEAKNKPEVKKNAENYAYSVYKNLMKIEEVPEAYRNLAQEILKNPPELWKTSVLPKTLFTDEQIERQRQIYQNAATVYGSLIHDQGSAEEIDRAKKAHDYERQKYFAMTETRKASTAPSKANSAGVTGNVSDILGVIAGGEGGRMGYDAANKGKAGDTPGGWPGLSNLTIGEVVDLQAKKKIFAAGKYQITPETLDGLLRGRYGPGGQLSRNDKFSPENQDALAATLIQWRLKLGGSDPTQQQYELSKEFAAVPVPAGLPLNNGKISTGVESYWSGVGGNKANISTAAIQTALNGTAGGTPAETNRAIAQASTPSSPSAPSTPPLASNAGTNTMEQKTNAIRSFTAALTDTSHIELVDALAALAGALEKPNITNNIISGGDSEDGSGKIASALDEDMVKLILDQAL